MKEKHNIQWTISKFITELTAKKKGEKTNDDKLSRPGNGPRTLFLPESITKDDISLEPIKSALFLSGPATVRSNVNSPD